ncbi:hypothetical protein TYRP_006255 [Tyrophagus putrescentiae]|nr:hypothetical protein TYRP_006255 [Tyrophagus putrescentiae]
MLQLQALAQPQTPSASAEPKATLKSGRRETTLKSGLEGGSKVATAPLLPWLMLQLQALAQPQLPLPQPNQATLKSGRRETTLKSASKEEAK